MDFQPYTFFQVRGLLSDSDLLSMATQKRKTKGGYVVLKCQSVDTLPCKTATQLSVFESQI